MRFSLILLLATLTTARPHSVSSEDISRFELLSQYSAAAYCANNNVAADTPITCPAGNCPLVQQAIVRSLLEFAKLGKTDTTGFVSLDMTHSLIVVSFRGSDSVANFVADATFRFVPTDICAGCKLHKGFHDSWMVVGDRVLESVHKAVAKHPSYQLVVTGHSLGGGIANIAAAKMHSVGLKPQLTTFGAPRTGNLAFAKYLNQLQHYRITHGEDPVTHVPPASFGFAHPFPEYNIRTDSLPVEPRDMHIRNDKDGKGDWATILRFNTTDHTLYFGKIASCGVDWKTGLPRPTADEFVHYSESEIM